MVVISPACTILWILQKSRAGAGRPRNLPTGGVTANRTIIGTDAVDPLYERLRDKPDTHRIDLGFIKPREPVNSPMGLPTTNGTWAMTMSSILFISRLAAQKVTFCKNQKKNRTFRIIESMKFLSTGHERHGIRHGALQRIEYADPAAQAVDMNPIGYPEDIRDVM
uniref:Uncharacterized protein n=1 Tax=Candidatus Kentrum sp. FW TaxID=2126338 RepID=A0A450SHS6_9GAMM|nr:MAG: hypothetical protein BECKFW1821B_GA0114236_10139 [Candidatus Kentron sp. FW]